MATGITRTGATLAGRKQPLPLPAQALDHATGWFAATGVLRALRRQRREGGSWHVRVSLARTAAFLQSLGTANALHLRDPAFEDIRHLTSDMSSPWGVLTHVRFPGTIGDLDLLWRTPPHRQGADAPAWA